MILKYISHSLDSQMLGYSRAKSFAFCLLTKSHLLDLSLLVLYYGSPHTSCTLHPLSSFQALWSALTPAALFSVTIADALFFSTFEYKLASWTLKQAQSKRRTPSDLRGVLMMVCHSRGGWFRRHIKVRAYDFMKQDNR